jgi:hypothetical protein
LLGACQGTHTVCGRSEVVHPCTWIASLGRAGVLPLCLLASYKLGSYCVLWHGKMAQELAGMCAWRRAFSSLPADCWQRLRCLHLRRRACPCGALQRCRAEVLRCCNGGPGPESIQGGVGTGPHLGPAIAGLGRCVCTSCCQSFSVGASTLFEHAWRTAAEVGGGVGRALVNIWWVGNLRAHSQLTTRALGLRGWLRSAVKSGTWQAMH